MMVNRQYVSLVDQSKNSQKINQLIDRMHVEHQPKLLMDAIMIEKVMPKIVQIFEKVRNLPEKKKYIKSKSLAPWIFYLLYNM